MRNKMTDNTIVVRDRTADSLLELLEEMENMKIYFEHIDLYSVGREHIEYWITELLSLWRHFEADYDRETDRNDILYLI